MKGGQGGAGGKQNGGSGCPCKGDSSRHRRDLAPCGVQLRLFASRKTGRAEDSLMGVPAATGRDCELSHFHAVWLGPKHVHVGSSGTGNSGIA